MEVFWRPSPCPFEGIVQYSFNATARALDRCRRSAATAVRSRSSTICRGLPLASMWEHWRCPNRGPLATWFSTAATRCVTLGQKDGHRSGGCVNADDRIRN